MDAEPFSGEPVLFAVPVPRITEDGVPQVSHVAAELVRSAGLGSKLKQAETGAGVAADRIG